MPNSLRRMPLAYVHIVHVMIHLLLVLAPIALYPKVGALTVLLIPLLTLFYHGLLELAMSFLVLHTVAQTRRLTLLTIDSHPTHHPTHTPDRPHAAWARRACAYRMFQCSMRRSTHALLLDRSDESHARTLVRIGSVWE